MYLTPGNLIRVAAAVLPRSDDEIVPPRLERERALALPARPSAMARGILRAGRAALGGERCRVMAKDRRVRMSGERKMRNRLQHRIERLEGGDRGSRVIVVTMGHLERDDDASWPTLWPRPASYACRATFWCAC